MDGLSLLAATHELQVLVNGKVDKIQQPERDTILLTIRAGGSNYRLLLCAHPENGRVQLTEASYTNPPEPPTFCMLLRKRLAGGRLTSVMQPGLDRVLLLCFEARDELGDTVTLQLVVELMGKYSNICFLNQNGQILDCVRHVSAGMSSVRILLPGIIYAPSRRGSVFHGAFGPRRRTQAAVRAVFRPLAGLRAANGGKVVRRNGTVCGNTLGSGPQIVCKIPIWAVSGLCARGIPTYARLQRVSGSRRVLCV